MTRSTAQPALPSEPLAAGIFGHAVPLRGDISKYLDGIAWSCGLDRLDKEHEDGLGAALTDATERANLEAKIDTSRFPVLPDIRSIKTGWRELPWPTEAWTLGSWTDPAARQLFEWITGVLRGSNYDGTLNKVALDDDDIRRIEFAVAILKKATPALAENSLPLIKILCVAETSIASWHMSQFPHAISISSDCLRSRTLLFLAEHLLHECLHEKYNMLRARQPYMLSPFDDSSSPGVLLPWSEQEGERHVFQVDRLVSTLHVYAHLAYFHARVLASAAYSDLPEAETRLQKNYERASFLAGALQWTDTNADLTEDGRELTAWLITNGLTAARRVAGSVGVVPIDYTFQTTDIGRLIER